MLNQLLLPNRYKTIGWYILISAIILLIISNNNWFQPQWLNIKVFAIADDEIFGEGKYLSFIKTDVTFTIELTLFIIGAMMVGFSKEKKEDEFIAKLRLSSLLWAVWVNYILLLLSVLFIYGTAFLTIMMYNMFTVLIIFIIRFNYILYRNTKRMPDEK